MTSALLVAPALAQETNTGVRPAQEQKSNETIAVVTGVVVDDATGNPIAGARLQVVDAPYSAMTNDEGQFSLKVPVDGQGRALHEIFVSGPSQNSTIVPLRNRRELTIRLMEAGFSTKTAREIYTPLGMKE